VDVIAGHVATTGDDQQPDIPEVPREAQCWPTHVDYASYPLVPAEGRAAFAAPAPAPPMAMMAKLEKRTMVNRSLANTSSRTK